MEKRFGRIVYIFSGWGQLACCFLYCSSESKMYDHYQSEQNLKTFLDRAASNLRIGFSSSFSSSSKYLLYLFFGKSDLSSTNTYFS